MGGKPADGRQVKSWQEREISTCGSACRIPQRSLRQIIQKSFHSTLLTLLLSRPSSSHTPPALFSSAYSHDYFAGRFYVSYGLLV